MPAITPTTMKNICLSYTCIYSHAFIIKMIHVVVDIIFALIVCFIVLNLGFALFVMYSALKY
tara:strand:+ start:31530 stop:31715 length:186 start_codon:yes stop_codon:yes gene_type:complete